MLRGSKQYQRRVWIPRILIQSFPRICVLGGKKYVEICRKREPEKKGKQTMAEGVNHYLGYPYGMPHQP